MQDTNEAELIAQSLRGDMQAYGQLVDHYKNAIYHHCFAIVHDEDAAEDMAQEAFIAAYYQLKKYKAEYKFSTWLFKISTNKCLNHLRGQSKLTPLDDSLTDKLPSHEPSPQQRAEDVELHNAVAQLPPKYQAVISLYYWQGLSYEEVAMAMNAPVNSVRVWLMRAKEQLRKEIA